MKHPTDDPSVPAKRGRPRSDEPGSRVTVWVREGDHDRLAHIAHKQERSISSVVRDLLKLKL